MHRRLSDQELAQAMDNIPPAVLEQFINKAIQEGKLPRPDGYDDQGEPIWKLESIGAHFGLDAAQQQESIQAFEAIHGPITRLPPESIHRVH